MNGHDVVVGGGSAAGLSAALVLARAGRGIVVIDSRSPRNGPAAHMHGYLSRDGMDPAELLAAGRTEVAGLSDRWARDVLHCPYCHGHEVRGRRLGVVGGGPGATRYAQIVRQWTDDLVYLTPADTLTATERAELVARGVGIVDGTVDHVVDDDDRLVGVQMSDGCVVPRDALFVPPRFVPNDAVLVGLGCATDDGWVRVDGAGRTSVPGVWAAGNVVDPRAQVITAAGAGSAAAISINTALVDDDVSAAVMKPNARSSRSRSRGVNR